MTGSEIGIMDRDGHRVSHWIDIGDGRSHLDVLLNGGMIRDATEEELARLAAAEHVSMPSGSQWGPGTYVIDHIDRMLAVAAPFTLSDVERAREMLFEEDRRTRNARVRAAAGLDQRCPTCGREVLP